MELEIFVGVATLASYYLGYYIGGRAEARDNSKKVISTPCIWNKNFLNPITTKKATAFVPINKPIKYNNPTRQPKPAPTPARERTPGPGVTIIKKLIII